MKATQECITPSQAPATPWLCDICGKPIEGDSGDIEIVNLDPGAGRVNGYPRLATDDSWGDVPRVGKRIGFHVLHGRCDPAPEARGYCLPAGLNENLLEWLDSLAHVGTKPWMGKWDIVALLQLWWVNRGEREYS